MAKGLVIVESPAKAKTINKYLGKNYKVVASMGHVRDLPKSRMGVDLEDGFTPEYEVIASRAKVIKQIKDEGKKADEIFVATDPDREGEAIGWHLAEELGKANKKKIRRLMFNEITKKAILEAVKNPMDIDLKMVDAQQAQRKFDTVVSRARSGPIRERLEAVGRRIGDGDRGAELGDERFVRERRVLERVDVFVRARMRALTIANIAAGAALGHVALAAHRGGE